MIGSHTVVTGDNIGRRTPEGVAPGPIGHPIVTGAAAYGSTATPERFGPVVLAPPSASIPGRSS